MNAETSKETSSERCIKTLLAKREALTNIKIAEHLGIGTNHFSRVITGRRNMPYWMEKKVKEYVDDALSKTTW